MTGKLFCRRMALALMAIFTTLAMTLLPADGGNVSHAQNTETTLVSNIGQTPETGTVTLGSSNDIAQEFTTGPNLGGYTLTGINFRLNSSTHLGTNLLGVTLHSGSATGTKVADFSGFAAKILGNYTYLFTPTVAISLNASTKYWIVLEDESASPTSFSLVQTASDSEDTGSAEGWMIADAYESRSGSSTGPFTVASSGSSAFINVKGYANVTPSQPTLVSNTGQEVGASASKIGNIFDVAQKFTTGSNRAGYTLTSTDMLLSGEITGATDLTMTMHSGSATGTKVADFNGPSSITFDDGTYNFTPTAALTLDASTSYWIVLEEPTTDNASLLRTASNSQDTGSAAGWLIADVYQSRTASSTGSFTDASNGDSGVIDVKGHLVPSPSLVSSIGQGDYLDADVNTRRAQAFTTGYNSTGYTVDAVEIDYRDPQGDPLALSICETNADESPNISSSTCKALTTPSSYTLLGRLTYLAPSSLTLDPETTYSVVFYSPQVSGANVNVGLGGTSSTAEDASSLLGWSIRDKFHNQNADDSWTSPGSVRSIRINLQGTPVANAPTAIDSTVTTSKDMAHTFTAANFNFTPTTAGDTLTKVHIVTLPDRGTLALSGVDVTAGDEITKANIDDGNLKFTPVADEFGDPYTSFSFRVEGSSLTSAATYKMTKDVTAVTTIFVSNFGQGREQVHNLNVSGNAGRAQSFTTGYNSTGYILGEVQVISTDQAGDEFAMQICPTNSSQTPISPCTPLTPPDSFAEGTLTFTAPVGHTLAAQTTYSVTMRTPGDAGNVTMSGTLSTDEDASSLAGWSIRDMFHNRPSNAWASISSTKSFRIVVKGILKAPTAGAPTAIDSAVSTSVSTAHTFTASHFNFTATTTGDTLTKVHIVTLPERGTLALSGAAVTAGDEITKADIDAGNLKFTPVADHFGDPYASFRFRVEGSSVTSAPTYKMTIDVTAVTTVLVSNFGQGSEQGQNLNISGNAGRAQSFTTGYNSTGYILDEVQVISTDQAGGEFVMQICPTNASETPISPCTPLTPPASFAEGTLTFTAPIGHTLEAATTYSVTMRTPGDAGNVTMSSTLSPDEDASSLTGWSIRNMFHARPSGFWQSISSTKSYRLTVKGILKAAPAGAPTANDNTVSTNEDIAHTFTAANFNFTATTTGDTLTEVHIVSLPADGTLALSGVAVTAAQEITKTDIDAANLKFTPVAHKFGDPYTSFLFRVKGSSVTSANIYKMTIDVTPIQDMASGAPTFSGSAKAGLVLTARTFSITEPDGIMRNSFTYQWVRVDADGASNPVNVGDGTNRYLLVDADIGKRIKVEVGFTDNLNHAESVPSEAYPSTGTIQAIVPTSVHWKWDGIPLDGSGDPVFGVGGRFRLLVITARGIITHVSGPPDADNSGDVSHINGKVVDGVGVNTTLDPYKTEFTALVSTTGVSTATPPVPPATARDNTETTGVGVPIYWFKGGKVADDYADFYDDSWDSNVGRNQDGATLSGQARHAWTGSRSNGVPSHRPLGSSDFVTYGKSQAEGKEIDDNVTNDGASGIGIYGLSPIFEVSNAAPTASNRTVTATEDTDYPFTAADFGFIDTDTEDSLESVTIVTVPAAGEGELQLNGSTIAAADLPATIDEADLGGLLYVPPAEASGTAFASFNFMVSDGLAESPSYPMTIDITAVEDEGVVTLSAATPLVGAALTATLSDSDVPVSAPSWTWSSSTSMSGTFTLIGGATSNTYTPVTSDVGKYLKATVGYTDALGSGKSAEKTSGSPTSTDPPPVFSPSSETFTVEENQTSGTIGTVTATDPDNQAIIYSVGGTDATAFNDDFSLDASTGAITVKSSATIDFEARETYAVTVTATDPHGGTGDLDLTISVTNADEPGTVEFSPTTPSVGTELTATLTDPDGSVSGESWTWSSSASSTGTFTPISGASTATYTPVAADLDRFLKATVTYTDGEASGKSASGTTANATLSNPPPEFGETSYTFTVTENSTSGPVGTVTATDPDNDTFAYSVGGTDAAEFNDDFSLDASTGAITVKSSATIDYEARDSYAVTITATDQHNSSNDVPVTINVTNADDAGTVSLSAATPTVDQALTATLTDPDGGVTVQSWTWSSSASSTGTFTPISGASTDTYTPVAADVGNYLKATVTYTDSFLASKSASKTSDNPVATDPPPEFGETSYTFRVSENATSGTVGTVTATDPDNQAITYSVGGTDETAFNDDFDLNASTGAITVKSSATIDYETKSAYTFTAIATDTVGVSGTVAVTINVSNVEEAGAVTLSESTPTEGRPLTATLTDPDGGVSGDSWSWSSSTSSTGTFTPISGATGATYTPVPGDVGRYLKATVTYSDDQGSGKRAERVSDNAATEDLTIPSPVRGLEASAQDGWVGIFWREPSRSGDASLTGYEYRYARGSSVPESVGWQTVDDSSGTDKYKAVSRLTNDTLYTFQVRAVNNSGKTSAPSQVQATPRRDAVATEPAPPSSFTATPGDVYLELVNRPPTGHVERRPFAEVTLRWTEPADHGNSKDVSYRYRYAEGSSVSDSTQWLTVALTAGGNLVTTARGLKPGVTYTFEMATVGDGGLSAPTASVRVRTRAYTGPSVTLSVSGSAREGQPYTLTVNRSGPADSEAIAVFEIHDTGVDTIQYAYAILEAGQRRATGTYTPPDDGQTSTGRQFTVRLAVDGLDHAWESTPFTVTVSD